MSAGVPDSRLLPAAVPADVLIVDPNLKDTLGHYLEYDAAVVDGLRASGARPILLAHRTVASEITDTIGARPTFRDDIWAGADRPGRWSAAQANLRFLSDLLRAMRSQKPGPNAVCFVHTFINRQFLALAILPLLLFRHRSYRFIYLFRYQAAFYFGRFPGLGFRLLEWLARRRTIRLASDSDRLAADLQRLTRLPVEVLPIPHVPPAARSDAAPMQEHRCHFVSLGNARDEKGILEIFAAIRWLRDTGQLPGCRFTLQCNDAVPEIAAAIAAFRDENLPQCRLLFSKLATTAYYDLLWDADIVLLPYWRSIYASRTSGVFMEALSAGKPVIATEDTWMADQLLQHGAGLLCADRDPIALGKTIAAARDTCAELAAGGMARRDAWTRVHNPDALARRLLSGDAAAPARRVAMLYPWSDLEDPRGGAGQRCSLLLKFLQCRPVALRVMTGGNAPPHCRDTIGFSSLGRSSLPFRMLRLLLNALMRLRYGADASRSDWLVWEFLRIRLDPVLRRRLRHAVADADVILLEYPFWASAVVPEARRLRRKVVMTCHDILSDQPASSPALRRLLWRWERKALMSADAVVAVSQDDVARLAQHGIQAQLAPNPTDTQLFASPISALGPQAPPYGKTVLFVGSLHPPNVRAVEHLRHIATQLAADPQAADIGIVVVGTCAPPETGSHFVALGPIEQPRLVELYRTASAAAIPLPDGTGSSLKTIEAMAAGLPVIGTPAAFRGLSVIDGSTGLIETEPDRFAARLVALLHDEARCAQIGSAARQFAARFDYRRCFAPYLSILGIADTADLIRRQP
jgi:glycosyltransferase involved in cell wall biosynthesis